MPISADHPVLGFYKMRRQRNGPWLPVAIWKKPDGTIVARVGPDMAEPGDIWTFCADHKVTNTAAKFAFEHGYWEDEPPPLPQRTNMPDDPFEALKLEIADKESQANELLTKHPEIKTQQTCDLFRNMQAQLLALNKRADGLFEVEKRPILEATRTCDEKYRFRAAVKVLSERLRSRFQSFLKAEEDRLKAEAEAKFKAEQEKVFAERKKLEEARQKKLASDPVAALTEAPPVMPELPLGPEPVKVTAGGGFGRKSGLRDEWVPIIEDYQQALLHFAEHPDIRKEVERLVKHAVKDSKGTAKIPGVRVVKDRKVA